MISFVVPAHNEEACLGGTLQAIHESARVVGQPHEVIVVDDASTDTTAEVARKHNATVLRVNHRQIAATRNSGGRAARGDRLIYEMPNTPGVRISNAIGLLILIVLLTGPIWYFIPMSLTPLTSPLGKFRFVIGILLCHAGLVFWPFAVVLFWNLLRRKQWIEWLKLAALGTFCLWQAWESTEGVIRIWTMCCHWLAAFYQG